MRVTGDLGFSSLVLVVLWVVVPVIGFVIRRKWQHAVARQEEIKRLLILASEEAERVEQEATYEYGTVSVVKTNQCAVCYCPTTTRCSRCKAVRYCSGNCQIIHWRRGHKEECCPPSTNHWNDDMASDFGQEAARKNHYGVHDENSEIEGAKSKISFKASLVTDIGHPEVSCGKDDNTGVERLVEGNIADSNSESSSNSFSGFSASGASSESSDEASVCESIISNEFERSEGHVFVDSALDVLDTTSIDNHTGITDSSSPKFASLVDSVDGFSTMHKLYQTRPIISKEESKLASNGTSGLSMCKAATVEPCSVSSDFWDGTLNSKGLEGDSCNDTLQSHSNDYSSNKNKKSVSGSPCPFSYSTLPSQQAKYPKEKYSLSDGSIPNSGGNSKSSAGSALSENGSMDSSKARNSSSINSKGSNIMNYGTSGGSGQLESREDNFEHLSSSYTHGYSSVGEDLKCAGSSSINELQSTDPRASNCVVDGLQVTSQLNSHAPADAQSASRTEGDSYYITKPRINGVQSSIATLSQDTICSANSKNGLKSSVLKVVDQFRGSHVPKCFPLAARSDIAGRYGDKGLFPYDLFVKLYNLNKVELQPFGLINCGNSCYANAVLQCLAFTPPLNAYFLQGLHSKACAKKKCCFMCEFESLILKSKEGKSPLSPMGILSQLQNIGSQLGNGREEDAHEFLRHVIDTMQSVCLSEAGVNAPGLEEEITLVGITFVGYLRSKIKCLKCGGKSERHERMMDLTVEIEGEIGTLEEALRKYTSTETLDGENKYHCVRCKSYEKAKKKLTVSEAPNVLTIALKRFQSGKFGKLNKPIRFPEILDLAPFMSGTSDKSPIYRLYGVVVHLDTLNAAFSGHYVCYVKNTHNKWFKVDDSMVTAIDLDEVLAKGAYMLLYARCSPRAPRLIRNIMVSSDKKRKALNGKITALKPKSASTDLSAANYSSSSISPDGSPTLDSFYSRFHHLRRILEEDSSSDNSSLISNSDGGSWSTDSTHDSTIMDDLSDGIFGDSICRNGSIWKHSDSESSSTSSSPMSSRHSPLADMDRYASGSPDANVLRNDPNSNKMADGPFYRLSNGVSQPSDTDAQHRKLDSSRSSSSNFRDSDLLHRLGSNHFNDIDSGVSCRKSRERTD